MAEILLAHGANPNTNVYAASSAIYEAHNRRDGRMMALLERHGGLLTAVDVAEVGLVENAARLLAEDAEGRTPDRIAGPGSSVAQDLLWGAIECPSPEIVMLALQATDWPPDDPRWHGILENGLYCAQRAIVAVTSTHFVSSSTGAIRMFEADGERRWSMRSRRREAG